jgi:hypothetical protein
MGAAEPDPKGLDHAWFADRAATAVASDPDHAIYAVTFHDAGGRFPLEWKPGFTVYAENVTKRYAKPSPVAGSRLLIDAVAGNSRVKAKITVVEKGNTCFVGSTLGSAIDLRNYLAVPTTEGHTYLVTASYGGKSVTVTATSKLDSVVHLNFDSAKINVGTSSKLARVLDDRFSGDPKLAAKATLRLADMPWTDEEAALAWVSFLAAPDAKLKAAYELHHVRTVDRLSPYLVRQVGEKPASGWGLVIAMHGGGNTTKEFNDREWHHMFDKYYLDHPEAGGYLYLALRAPNDTWNGFYDDAISPMIERLILQFVKYGGVDPNRVVVCGASHGGYGSFVIGTKIPYRFAAIHPAAGAPTPGETAGENLRDVYFTYSVGENDTAYGRIDRDREFEVQRTTWKAKYGGYEGGFEPVAGAGHQINPHEKDQTGLLLKHTRGPWPDRVVWHQTDTVLHRFYWLEALSPVKDGYIEATVDGNTITVTAHDQTKVALWLSPSLVDFHKPVQVIFNGIAKPYSVKPSLATYCDGLAQTGDPYLAAPVRLVIAGRFPSY